MFVDDNSDTTWKMFEHFAASNITSEGKPGTLLFSFSILPLWSSSFLRPFLSLIPPVSLVSYWFVPPATGKNETFQPIYRQNIQLLLDVYRGDFNLGSISFPSASFPSLRSSPGTDEMEGSPDLEKLNAYLLPRSYLLGWTPSRADAVEFECVLSPLHSPFLPPQPHSHRRIFEPPTRDLINAWRWYAHIASFTSVQRAQWPDTGKFHLDSAKV